MAARSNVRSRPRRPLAGALGRALICLAALSWVASDNRSRGAAEGEEGADPAAQPRTGRLIRVPLPINGDVENQVKRTVERALNSMKGAPGRPVLVFELSPLKNH